MEPASTTGASLPDAGRWATSLAARLRYLQANFADDAAENREAYLEDEVRRALQPVPASKRAEYLDALNEKFPTWESATVSVSGPSTLAAPQSPEEIWNLFLKTLPQYSAEQREKMKARLAESGLVLISNEPVEGEALGEIQQKLKLTADDRVDSARLGNLFATLAELAMVMDQLAWNVWKNVAPKSGLRRESKTGDLRTSLRRSLTGDAEVSASQVAQQLEKTRQLIAGLLAALGPAGKNYARRYLTRYSPEAVRDLVKLEGASIFGNADARYWKKYTELAQEISEASIQTDIQDAVAKYAEDLMRGTSR